MPQNQGRRNMGAGGARPPALALEGRKVALTMPTLLGEKSAPWVKKYP